VAGADGGDRAESLELSGKPHPDFGSDAAQTYRRCIGGLSSREPDSGYLIEKIRDFGPKDFDNERAPGRGRAWSLKRRRTSVQAPSDQLCPPGASIAEGVFQRQQILQLAKEKCSQMYAPHDWPLGLPPYQNLL
jgi:hypothetical protein